MKSLENSMLALAIQKVNFGQQAKNWFTYHFKQQKWIERINLSDWTKPVNIYIHHRILINSSRDILPTDVWELTKMVCYENQYYL